jgi:hypothetical protein
MADWYNGGILRQFTTVVLSAKSEVKYCMFSPNTMYLSHKISYMFRLVYSHHQAGYTKKGNIHDFSNLAGVLLCKKQKTDMWPEEKQKTDMWPEEKQKTDMWPEETKLRDLQKCISIK